MPYANLDNAATTPAARAVMHSINDLMDVYGSVQRGAGIKSIISTAIYERSLEAIRNFAGAQHGAAVVVASNTTTAINRLAANYGFLPDDIVLVSQIEHSSNDLPWRAYAKVSHVRCQSNGALDLDDLTASLKRYGRRVRLVALTAASNVSGYLPPVREATRIAHEFGAEVFIDGAQLAAHRAIQMRTTREDESFDYVAFSGHKMYAPFGVGVVIGKSRPFEQLHRPDIPGGGTVDMITDDTIIWAAAPARFTPGTPNLVGLVALATAAELLSTIGFDNICKHERVLVSTGLQVLLSIDGVKLYGQACIAGDADRLPIFPFTVHGYQPGLVAAVLSNEYGVAVRAGHLCQYEFMRRELGISPEEQARQEVLVRNGDKSSMYGMVRASCGSSNCLEDLNRLGDALRGLIQIGPQLEYAQDRATGQFIPCTLSTWERLVPQSLRQLSKLSRREHA